MQVLLVHPNFPAQLRHVAAALGAGPNNVVVFATKNPRREWSIPGVSKVLYKPENDGSAPPHRLARPFQDAVIQGEAMHRTALTLKRQGFTPDIIYGNSGWGGTMYLKDIWPDVPMVCYFEWFYDPFGADALFGQQAEAPPESDPPTLMRSRNASVLNDLWACDRGISPTQWQKQQFPKEFHHKIDVLHDGIDTQYFAPNPEATFPIPELEQEASPEVITFAGRGMEPYRGFPQFMKALEILQKRRKNLHAVIVGEDRVCYGPPRRDGKSWKQYMTSLLDLDARRTHFTGPLPYGHYKQVLQASHAHVYLTRPFVLSWSFIEAMACGCPLVASATHPVQEVASDGDNALLCDFFTPQDIAQKVESLLDDRKLALKLGQNARQTALTRYSLKDLLPRHIALLEQLASGNQPA